jgi:hypothetical protein
MMWNPPVYQFGVPKLAQKSMQNMDFLDNQALGSGLVEQRGIEPLTSALRTPRSPN